jgi:predicted amidohydrolase
MTIIKAALVVQNCPVGYIEKNIESTQSFIAEAVEKGARIIVFPEMNLTGYITGVDILSIAKPLSQEILEPFIQTAHKLHITILAGLAEKAANGRIFATHCVFGPDKSVDIYRKLHISPFEKIYFSAGNKIPVFNSCNLSFGIQLCYDAHFPELSLAMALKRADIIFIPHASPRGSSKEKYHSWLRHLMARAFDNGLFIAAVNQTGANGSGLIFPGLCLLIGPDGKILYKSLEDKEGIHIIHIHKQILNEIRSHKMKYFLPHRRADIFHIGIC